MKTLCIVFQETPEALIYNHQLKKERVTNVKVNGIAKVSEK